ncbi:phage head-tail connector protein [Neoehrlichia mikurensis]|uniref:Phage head-tail connector protein n=1 Tax=Neoehrlichia mikurensis TaxID=89586 RepID=A0A9Q9F3R8_9RICK|nr:phage head-tail connector protein [Neoehrlichia mikurensis]QXK91940.1 phage head-tail connector protein [Neoehrlichia mikurensis]QXK93153.1 phage head-tail connector protein [Neoehrlichia mikurensis]QXK93633.1 phage head-tail connector protein [Neoehrlichia mikurensis]UTO55412.1 phage head-tail connector protein [Neoehrlichia mikurensis]UTO56331.1 phage head-tail connector protein [Neoehrlichia mikurensis]
MLQNSIFHIIRKTLPKIFPVTLLEAKSFLRVKHNMDDDLIMCLIAMSSEYAQWYMEKSLMKQQWQISCYDNIPRKIQLPFSPIVHIVSVKIISYNKDEFIVPIENYYADLFQSSITFYNIMCINRMDIIYEAGYYDANIIPMQIKHGILHHVAISYKNREAEAVDNLNFVKDMYSPFRELKLVL